MANKQKKDNLLSPSEVAEKLKISVATLRKYSLIFEDVTKNEDYFERTKQNTRLYTKQNVADLNSLIKLRKKSGLTLRDAAKQVTNPEPVKKTKPKAAPKKSESGKNSDLVEMIQSLQITVRRQNRAIEDLKREVDKLKGNKTSISFEWDRPEEEDIDDVVDNTEVENSKPEIVLPNTDVDTTDDFIDDLPDLEEVHKAREELGLIDGDPRKEILAKSQENFEDGKQADHRTLADMQPGEEKKHWWDKFKN